MSRFVKSPNNNLRYIGLDSLSCIVPLSTQYAWSIRWLWTARGSGREPAKKTLDLLYRMTKSHNVEDCGEDDGVSQERH